MIFGFRSDKGRRRAVNEDSYFVLPGEKVFIVADGVGGHNSGEVASSMTVEYIAGQVREYPPDNIESDEELKKYFLEMLRRINFRIFRSAKAAPLNYGMATTLVMMYVRGDNAYIINVGDSRAYLLRDGLLQQITDDHTYVNDLVKRGVLTKEQAALRTDRNMITRAVGAELTLEPDFILLRVFQDDIILLCSDGLYDELDDNAIQSIITEGGSMRDTASELVDRANEHGGRDNITVVTVKI